MMKSFLEIVNDNRSLSAEDKELLNCVLEMKLSEIVEFPSHVDESDLSFKYSDMSEIMNQYGDTKIKDMDEGLIGKILGGITGFVIGPSIGKVIANSLGIEKGIIYDMLTSRLVGAALGSAITKYIGGKS